MKPSVFLSRLFTTAALATSTARFINSSETSEVRDEVLQKFSKNQNPRQLGSVSEIINLHVDMSLKRQDVKTVLTSDQATLDLAQKIISDYSASEKFNQESETFLNQMIVEPRNSEVNKKGSVEVVVSKIEGSKFEEEYKKYQDSAKKTMLCVGGPSAVDQALLASVIPQIAEKTNVVYVSAGHWYSNLVNSALQVHARHGNALNADDALTGHALLAVLMSREIIGIVNKSHETLDAVDNPDYRKIHVKFTLDPEKLAIYLGNEGNWLKQKIVKQFGGKDQHDLNREESVVSAEIMHSLQEVLSESLGRDFKIIEGNRRDNSDTSSIHVALTPAEVMETRIENNHLAAIDIASIELTREEIEKLFGKNEEIISAFSYPGDGHVVPQYHTNSQALVKETGNQWMEPAVVKQIFVKAQENGEAQVAGAVIENNGSTKFIAADSLHFTGGYMAKLMIEGTDKELVSNPITTATGVSSNIILERNEVTDNFISRFGNTGQLAVTNSHWTMLAKNDTHVIMRVTGGGNTGSEEYNPNYFLNNIANTLRIFGGENSQSPLVGIVRTYGCPRSINAINATTFEKVAEGFVVSYGKGGTGNTKRFSEAVIALSELGFEKETVDYFSQLQTAKGTNLGSEISEMLNDFRKERAFLVDSSNDFLASIGYRDKTIFDVGLENADEEILNSTISRAKANQLLKNSRYL